MARNYSDVEIRRELANADNSMAHHLNSQVGELPRSGVNADPRSGTSMTTQIAWEEDEIMEDAEPGDEESSAFIKNLITETTTSIPHFLDIADCVTGDGNGIAAAPNSTIINSYGNSQDSCLNREALNSFPTKNFPLYMLGTSDGVLNNNYATDDLTTITRRYGVFPFIRKTARARFGSAGETADMCFYNHQLSHLLSQHLTGPLPQLTDPTGADQIFDIPMTTLAPRKNITLVLDIDGTLIHSSMSGDGADFSFPMLQGANEHTVYVKKRPYLDAFLKKVAEMFEIVVFTASISSYADQLLNILDPHNRLISRRYYRDSCVLVDGNYLKNLTIIEADLAKVAIIDNTPEVFQLQVNNGIPIKTWSSDPYDASLPDLIPFLETLAVAVDVRPIIANKFANYPYCSNIRNS